MRSKEAIQIVRPAGTRYESMYLCLAMLVVILVSGTAILHRTRSDEQKVLLDYQMSGYGDLNSFEQGTFNDLYAAALEIDAYHDENDEKWPSIRELEDQFIPPFIHDQAWKKRGKLLWTQKVPNVKYTHVAAYMGKTSDPEVSGSFLLVMSHRHRAEGDNKSEAPDFHEDQPFRIWYYNHKSRLYSKRPRHPQRNIPFPDSFIIQNLIMKGWKEVVPYKGEDEIRRLNGEGYD